MFEKFKNLSDDDLVFAYKHKRDDDIELELLDRYRFRIKKVAGEYYVKYKFLYQLEFEDLYSVALGTLFSCIKNFSMKGFYKYWKIYVNNELTNYVRQFKLSKSEVILSSELDVDELSTNLVFKQDRGITLENPALSKDIDVLLNDESRGFNQLDIEIYKLSYCGYKVKEIAILINKCESYVRRRQLMIKKKIQHILFNQ